MSAYLFDWVNLLGRWVHMITGIAWIGASFYFVWLDNHLETPKQQTDTDRGVSGEVWSVHGGGFYHAQKYQIAPPELPETLHWFKWEAYTTWITGMFMMAIMYWYGAEIYLIDAGVADISKPVAIAIGIAVIAFGWFGYNWLCESEVGKNERNFALIVFVVLTVLAYLLCHIFSGRGAYMHFGAMLGTIMVGNVMFVIIPGQKDLVKAKAQGRQPNPIHGIRGKQRSVHNTYFTLPVLFVMISNHYALTYGHQFNWLILIAITLIGALIRIYFVARHKGKASLVPIYIAAVLLAAVVTAATPRLTTNTSQSGAAGESVTMAAAAEVIEQRCSSCHAGTPTQAGFQTAPMGIVFDTEQDITRHAEAIIEQSVLTKVMPIGNLTGMKDEERDLLGRWFQQLSP